MQATLQIQLTDALSADELRQLIHLAAQRKQPIEQVIYEAVKSVIKIQQAAEAAQSAEDK